MDKQNNYWHPDELLTTGQAAHYLKRSPGTLQNWRLRKGIGPRFLKIGNNVYYPKVAIQEYLKQHGKLYDSTSQWKEHCG